MDMIEQRMEGMEERLGTVENNVDKLINIQSGVVEILREQRGEILELRRDIGRLANLQVDVVEMLRVQHEELILHREELQETKRFNQQTRKLWVIIARKMDWLDEDLDIDSL